MHTRKTFCRFCHANCAIEVDIEGERAVAVRGDVSDPQHGSSLACLPVVCSPRRALTILVLATPALSSTDGMGRDPLIRFPYIEGLVPLTRGWGFKSPLRHSNSLPVVCVPPPGS